MGFDIVWESRGACKTFYGHVSDQELMQSVMAIEGDRRFDGLRYVINDFLKVESFAISEANVRIIAAIDGAAALTNPNIKIAIVATDQQIQDLAKLYADSPLNTYPTRIFATTDDARAWL